MTVFHPPPSWREIGPAWQRARRYGLPPAAVAKAAERRRAGDWRGACAAARVDVAFDPADVAREHGAQEAARLEEDLRHLVPDLLHWHLPRDAFQAGGVSTFTAGRRFALTRYRAPGAPWSAVLQVAAPPTAFAPQRPALELASAVSADEDWTADRYLFDDRHCHELAEHYGGHGRVPFFHADGTPRDPGELPASDPGPGDAVARAEWALLLAGRPGAGRAEIQAAFDAVGIGLVLEEHPKTQPWERGPWSDLSRLGTAAPMLAHRIRRLAGRGGRPLSALVRLPDRQVTVRVEAGGRRERPLVWPAHTGETRRRTPAPGCWHDLPDLDLLRGGLLAPDELHPLVRSALFPGRPPQDGPADGPGHRLPATVRVRCEGVWHKVRLGDGDLRIPHTEEEARREQAFGAFGGAVGGCFAARRAWRSGAGRLPRALRRHRNEVFLRARHGDADGVLRLLDAGLDPHVTDGRGWTLLHALYAMDHEALLPRLLEAGLDVDAADRDGRTPALLAVQHHGSPALVRALLDAGARTEIAAAPMPPHGPSTLSKAAEKAERDDLEFLP
ncbi:ankyrin repeat domain-containing protein [Actinomadura violacea]|uniref:Ankyrin repeat domain-containing protein n=1 Tax=Actinomadura violacea TaxID=2819934 RepID=A0ABS3RLB5_9ACTN|nr:ankyrin repeat domain-containing protein [Actinomadura violacea]MBO2457148.1 ankyrin repeat domain-containing protein [Actinomadura violacea]